MLEASADEGVGFYEARDLGPAVLGAIQVRMHTRLLRALTKRGLLEREDAQAMTEWEHGGGASRPQTVPASNACCATAPDPPLRWN